MPLILVILSPIVIFFILISLTRHNKINIRFFNKIEYYIDSYIIVKIIYYFASYMSALIFIYALASMIIIFSIR